MAGVWRPEQLEEWRRDITNYMQALDEMIGPDGQRPADLAPVACPVVVSAGVMPVRSQGPTPGGIGSSARAEGSGRS